jgi:hypothetical protein
LVRTTIGRTPYLTRKDEIAFDASDVEVFIAGRDDEERVDVGGDELNPAVVARVRPLEQARPIENAHEAPAVPVDQQPVADGGPVQLSPAPPLGRLEEIESSKPSPTTVTLPR